MTGGEEVCKFFKEFTLYLSFIYIFLTKKQFNYQINQTVLLIANIIAFYLHENNILSNFFS